MTAPALKLRPAVVQPGHSRVTALLAAVDESAREQAWALFVERYSLLLLHAARSTGCSYDGAMDRYAYILDQLRRDDFKRLRRFDPDGPSTFSTWLVVVARRVCIDLHRQRYGRPVPADGSHEDQGRSDRRHLEDLVSDSEELAGIPDSSRATITTEYTARERDSALKRVLDTLEPGDRLLVKLRFEEDLTAREIAEVLGFPSPGSVYRRLETVVASLRGKLELAGIEQMQT
jgi:RNA polymerase sigma factor (sigma-70 family)